MSRKPKKMNEVELLKPWVITPELLNVFVNMVQARVKGEEISVDEVKENIAAAGVTASASGYYVANGIGVIPIVGVIGKDAWWADVTVGQIQKDFNAALEDPNVKEILLCIDSPGGTVSGTPELSDFIFAARGKKPIVAFAEGMMCSGAYWIGSAADKIYATRASAIGSIGVYTVLFDAHVLLHNMGIKANLVKAGKYKAAGDITQPMTDEDKKKTQERIDAYYDLFVEAVSRNRNITHEEALSLADGNVLIGQKAMNAGLVDGVRTYEDVITPSTYEKPRKKVNVTAGCDQIKEDAGIEVPQTNTLKEDEKMELTLEKIKAEHKPLADALIAEGKAAGIAEGKAMGIEEGKTLGKAEAKAADKVRIEGILGAMPPGQDKLAMDCIKDGSSIEEAKDKFLAVFKKEAPASLGPNDEASEAEKSMEGMDPKVRAEKEWDSNPKLHSEYLNKEAYVGFRKAQLEGRVKLLSK